MPGLLGGRPWSIRWEYEHPFGDHAPFQSSIYGVAGEKTGLDRFRQEVLAGEDFASHLGFAFRHANIDPLTLKRLFEAVPRDVVEQFVTSAPTGVASRRAWFWYEFLTGGTLDIPVCPRLQQSISSMRRAISPVRRVVATAQGAGQPAWNIAFLPHHPADPAVDGDRCAPASKEQMKLLAARVRMSWRARQVSCFWLTAERALRSKVSGLRAGGWSGGHARCFRQEKLH